MLAFDPLDVLLLRAALLDEAAARPAWSELADRFDLDNLDHGRMRLLPLLHHNLHRFGIPDRRLQRLRGIRHYHWARNQTRLRQLVPLLKDLQTAGVEIMLMKGAALLAGTLPDFSLRPMDDVDLLVRRVQLGAALPLMIDHGYRPAAAATLTTVMQFDGPGYPFVSDRGDEVDLHWHALHADLRPEADEGFWQGARLGRLFGTPILVPHPADLLLQVCAHAAEWSTTHGLRWAADATIILRQGGENFDWDRLRHGVTEHRLEAPLASGLGELKRHLGLPIPAALLRDLRRRTSRISRLLSRLDSSNAATLSPWQRRLLRLDRFRRSRSYLMQRPLLRALPSYLRHCYPADSRVKWLAVLGFHALGRPDWLRRRLRIDERLRRPAYEQLPALGTPLTAKATLRRQAGFLDGWSYNEPHGRWTSASEARLGWRLPAGSEAVVLQIEGWVFSPPRAPRRRVDLWVAGQCLATLVPPSPGEQSVQSWQVTVPAPLLRGKPALILTMAVHDPISPLDAGYNEDRRALGFCLHAVRQVPQG